MTIATLFEPHPLNRPKTDIRRPLLAGALIIGLGFGGMMGWAGLAPLHSAVVAPGVLAPESGRKVVKNAEGGVITAVLVREGERVTRGQVLMRLDETEAKARLLSTTAEMRLALARAARLEAQISEADAIQWPAELTGGGPADPALAAVMDNQQRLFEAERVKIAADVRMLTDRAASLRREAGSLAQQREFLKREIGIVGQQRATMETLASNGNATRTQLNELRKEEARANARDRELAASVAEREQQALEADAERSRLVEGKRADRLTELQQVRSDSQRLTELRRDAENRFANREVKSPEDGTVTGLGSRAMGVLVQPGEAMLEVVPDEKRLLVELRVAPNDIDAIRIGMHTDVVLSAYDTRTIGSLKGTVEYVSADRIEDPATRTAYFLTRVRIDGASPHEAGNLRIVAGMPVEAHVLVAERTPLDYLLAPLGRSYARAFTQQ